MNHPLVRYSPEMEGLHAFHPGSLQAAASGRSASNAGVFNEGQVLELAAEILEARGSEELGAKLDQIILRASRALGRPILPMVAQGLRDLLQQIAGRALPFVTRPPVLRINSAGANRSTMPGSQSIAGAARLFGLELEGLSPEDEEFELAKRFVRLTGEAVRHAVVSPHTASPKSVALRAVARAARDEAPSLCLDLGSRPEHAPIATQISKEGTMHNIDRTMSEYSSEFSESEGEQFEFGEAEYASEAGGTFGEAEVMELATELLEVSNEAELDRFLGNLVSRVTQAAGSFARSSLGQALGGVLKGVAKKALPMAGTAIGGYIGGPLGAQIGTGLANAASSALKLEGEMAGEDREFEGAKQFVRMAAQTATNAASAPPGADPRTVVQQAAMAAARQLAPGLVSGPGMPMAGQQQHAAATHRPRARSGRWLRRGSKIVLYGV